MSNISPLSLEATSGLQLLVLSNGHGEDVIATSILQKFQQQENPPDMFALPLVGEGRAYQKLGIPCIGSVRTMPSGGFIYMDGRELVRDLRGGLLQLTLNQIQAVRGWVGSQKKLGNKSAILAVGDIVPLLFAAFSGANYAFVGTAKSEYYVRNEVGLLPRKSQSARWENFSGSIYHPWERWLMSRRRCQAVFPRDALTTEILQKWSIPAFDLGNPMMDDLEAKVSKPKFPSSAAHEPEVAKPLVVTLLPGSRPPEAYANWEIIMLAVSALMASFSAGDGILQSYGNMIFLGAIAPGLDQGILSASLKSQGWETHTESPLAIADADALIFGQRSCYVVLTQQGYNDCLYWGDLAIAMAGTATEQFVGLGKPAIAIPGNGPQYNPAFAEAQSRLLGASLFLVDNPGQVPLVVQSLWQNPNTLQIISENGIRRMGKPGAARRIADCLRQKWC
ncbi:lipid-A-disaccharide synthase-related protein [Nodularia spumigena]|uniref:Lipid-A-disaccharide synthase-related protein n=1 Tax=Nodularia spumigena UHCC 0060 TaxID=3110300 RepID=A0ABU5UML3_NODSP|nr:lipid-A-disaccharide synthase-related protein [Nodularia spumigena]MEA5525905.1 lipid-A-disaccharide synthase-related protein [Nodularia spumigena UHCC 0143]MEA5607489.1 lipid-A-disaccharide synthase-related protein [Nodularia spumigena UHCC 0060]MEA5614412.1 lipid-A-disaccharide synthase-related protein [Nodularia spumigena UHCC 0040]